MAKVERILMYQGTPVERRQRVPWRVASENSVQVQRNTTYCVGTTGVPAASRHCQTGARSEAIILPWMLTTRIPTTRDFPPLGVHVYPVLTLPHILPLAPMLPATCTPSV